MSLTKSLQEQNTNYTNTDPNWRHYVLDHLSNIKLNSTVMVVSANEMFRYKYRPGSFLENNNISKEFTWIFMLINQLETLKDFSELKFVNIPSIKYIEALYSQYTVYLQTINDTSVVRL